MLTFILLNFIFFLWCLSKNIWRTLVRFITSVLSSVTFKFVTYKYDKYIKLFKYDTKHTIITESETEKKTLNKVFVRLKITTEISKTMKLTEKTNLQILGEIIMHFIKDTVINTIQDTRKNFIKIYPKKTIPERTLTPELRTPTPNLTLYYPLQTSILSVSIRFMGTLLLVFGFLSVSVFLILNLSNISFEFLNLIFFLNTLLLISTLIYHVINSLYHYISSIKVTSLVKKISLIKETSLTKDTLNNYILALKASISIKKYFKI